MKSIRHIFSTLSLVSLLIAGCSSVDLKDQNPGNPNNGSGSTGNNPQSSEVRFNGYSFEQLMTENLFYFGFNRYDVNLEDYRKLEAHAQLLKQRPDLKVTIAGHTDDIGSSEFNLALGQRRSEAVRAILIANGATDNQIEAVSFGKEKPVALGDSEQSRALNRRAHIIYQ